MKVKLQGFVSNGQGKSIFLNSLVSEMNLCPVKGHNIIMDLKVNNEARHTVQGMLIK